MSEFPGLDVDESWPIQRRTWIFERVGWAVFFLVLVAAVLGLFGEGVLSTARAAGGAATLTWQRFARQDATTELRLDVTSPVRSITFDRAFLAGASAPEIFPRPDMAEARDDEVAFGWDRPQKEVVVRLTPRGPGMRHGFARAGDGPRIPFEQLVFP